MNWKALSCVGLLWLFLGVCALFPPLFLLIPLGIVSMGVYSLAKDIIEEGF